MPKTKLRVAFFGDDFSRKGKGTALVIQKIAEELVAHHADTVDVILLRPAGACASSVCQKVRSVIIPRKFSTILSYLWFFIVHRSKYDVVVFNRMVYPGFWFLRAKKRILFMHDASISEAYVVPRTFVTSAFENFLKYVGQYFLDTVIGDTQDARTWIAKYFAIPPRKVQALYLAAGEEYQQYDVQERSERSQDLKRKYNVSSPYILDVSRFDPHKNIERALDAFFILKEQRTDPLSLVFVGGRHTPDYSDHIEEKIRSSKFRDDVLVLDYVAPEDMPALYNCAAMLAYPSLVEGFGLPVIEAMKCGTPVVTSNISCLPEIAGDAAVLIDPLNVQSIADGISRVLEDPSLRDALVSKGLQRAKGFSWRKSADDFMRMF